MNKLIITVGISGSGKSTFASTTVRHNSEKYVIVNRDKIRELLYGYTEETILEYYHRNDLNKLEKQVTAYENILIKQGLSIGKDVIVDATHLKIEYIDRFKFFNVDTEIKWFDCDLKEAIERDSKRNRKVGESIIKRQYDQYIHLKKTYIASGWKKEYLPQNPNLPTCIIFDIDGTLAHKGNRSPYDWSKVNEDTIDQIVRELYMNNVDQNELIICSGRDNLCRIDTEEWIDTHLLYYPKEVHMRKNKDQRPDWQVKREMWEDISTRYNILYMVDDRNQVVDYARSLGLKVFQVAEGNF